MKFTFLKVFLVICCLGLLTSCDKDETEEPEDKPGEIENNGSDNETEGSDNESRITSTFYFHATIDGKEVLIQDGKFVGSGISSSAGIVEGGYVAVESTILINPVEQKNHAGFGIIKYFPNNSVSSKDKEAMFTERAYVFGKKTNSYHTGFDGAYVHYLDENGVNWRSDYGSGDQRGSSFEITEHKAVQDFNAKYYTTAKFDCVLYDSSGNSIKLENGVCKSRTLAH